jgi:hypothetical protein
MEIADDNNIDLQDIPDFDLYSHMRKNIKEYKLNCIDDQKNTKYCFDCQISSCIFCSGEDQHKDHRMQGKYNFNTEYAEKVFNNIENDLRQSLNVEKVKNDLAETICNYVDNLHVLLDEVKEKKLNEIETLFKNYENGIYGLVNKVDSAKQVLMTFQQKYGYFFDHEKNRDIENTVFLINYDIISCCYDRNKDILDIFDSVKTSYKNYETDIIENFEKMMNCANGLVLKDKDKALTDDFRVSSSKLSYDFYKDIVNRISKYEDHLELFKKNIWENFQKYGSLKEIERYITVYNKKYCQEKPGLKNNSDTKKVSNQSLTLTAKDFTGDYINTEIDIPNKIFEEIKEEHMFTEESVNLDLDGKAKSGTKKNSMVKQMAKTKYNTLTVKTEGNSSNTANKLKTPRKSLKSSADKYDRKPITKRNGSSDCESSTFTYTLNSMLNRNEDYTVVNYKSRDDISLSNKILQRYFSFFTLDAVNGKHLQFLKLPKVDSKFKMPDNNNGFNFRKSFRLNLMNVENQQLNETESTVDLEAVDMAKPIEGTNEIQIYDRKKRQLIKKQVPLTKKVHGCSVFLDGCRYILHNDRLFITGGRDEYSEYSVVLMYDIKDFVLTRMSDMNYTRSYHTVEYNNMVNSFLVIGGENNRTCEVYDIDTNLWHLLPDLSVGRANIQIYFDAISSNLYAFFGKVGSITTGLCSEVIDVLDLNDMDKGWQQVIYNNRCDLDFRYYCSVSPLFKDKIIVIGTSLGRETARTSAIYSIKKNEFVKIDNKMYEEIRMEAIKSPRLSMLIAKLSKYLG